MARVQRALCDICGGEKDVHLITVVYEGDKANPWEADLCEKDYRSLFGDLMKKSRRAGKSNVRPQHRMEKLDDSKFSL